MANFVSTPAPVPNLPNELFIHILENTDYATLWNSCRSVSRLFRSVAEEVLQKKLLPSLSLVVPQGHNDIQDLRFHSLSVRDPESALFANPFSSLPDKPFNAGATYLMYQRIGIVMSRRVGGTSWLPRRGPVRLNKEEAVLILKWKEVVAWYCGYWKRHYGVA